MTVELKKRNLLLEEQENIMLDHFGDNKLKKTYEHSVRAFAVTLHFFSPKAYAYVRQKFQNCLPHPKTLAKWYCSVDAKPGLTSEALNFLKLKVKNSEEKKIICSLVFDEISIRKHLEYAGSEYYVYVNCGNGLQGDSMELATEALVFMLVCVNEAWKLPIGINSQQKVSLVKQALTLLGQVGVTVSSITFDGCAANFSMCNLLNCHFNKANVKADFAFENRKYF
ncbi:hypothetical protein HUJ04_012907 [Dendroctonus ponderosae]|nr:hypothetical protein HUJ04_012907 [Dendroctonus ponderosae]